MHHKRKILFAYFMLAGMLVFSMHFASATESSEIIVLDNLGNIYEPVLFDHAMHMDIASCASCHHHTTGTAMPVEDNRCFACHKENCTSCTVACTDCHAGNRGVAEEIKESQTADLYHKDRTGLKRAYHLRCLGCHREMETASGCQDCHAKKDSHLKVTQINVQPENNSTR
jgi:hypothetical protein